MSLIRKLIAAREARRTHPSAETPMTHAEYEQWRAELRDMHAEYEAADQAEFEEYMRELDAEGDR